MLVLIVTLVTFFSLTDSVINERFIAIL